MLFVHEMSDKFRQLEQTEIFGIWDANIHCPFTVQCYNELAIYSNKKKATIQLFSIKKRPN